MTSWNRNSREVGGERPKGLPHGGEIIMDIFWNHTIDELREGAYEKGSAARQNMTLGQGTQVSIATLRAATTSRHCHTQRISGNA